MNLKAYYGSSLIDSNKLVNIRSRGKYNPPSFYPQDEAENWRNIKINFDHNTDTVNELDFGNYTHFNTGIGLGESAETVEDLLFDENYFNEPFNIINDINNNINHSRRSEMTIII